MLVAQALDDLQADRLALEQALTLVAQMAWDAATREALSPHRPTPPGGGGSGDPAPLSPAPDESAVR